MSYLDWKVGDKVVCIKTGVWSNSMVGEKHPQYGETYTIRDIAPGPDTGRPCIRLVEIVNPRRRHGGTIETTYWAERFRPVQTRKTDIAIFTAMLDSTKSKVSA